jgi:hypothetical protein
LQKIYGLNWFALKNGNLPACRIRELQLEDSNNQSKKDPHDNLENKGKDQEKSGKDRVWSECVMHRVNADALSAPF